MDPPADWPFESPPNVAVITSRKIMTGGDWIAYVWHDEDDGGWQFHGSEPTVVEDAAIIALGEILELDSSIANLADLPVGWEAWRETSDSRWERSRHD